jgi:hypothetical protein
MPTDFGRALLRRCTGLLSRVSISCAAFPVKLACSRERLLFWAVGHAFSVTFSLISALVLASLGDFRGRGKLLFGVGVVMGLALVLLAMVGAAGTCKPVSRPAGSRGGPQQR